jgi:hypothetical protein
MSPGEAPSQFAVVGSRRKRSASELLALAVVSQAVNDIALYHDTRYAWSRRVYRDAWRWIFSDDRVNTFSFLNLCEALDLSPGRLRAGVNQIIKRHESEAARRNAA